MFALLARSVSAQAEIAPPDLPLPLFHSQSRQYLLGDWKGKRSALAEKGVTFDFFYISDMLANPSGGLEQTQGGWERIRGTIDINVDRLMQWQGLRFHATGLWQSGVNLGGKVGTLASPSDLVSAHTTRLDSFWLEQNLGTRFNAPFARRNKDRVACAFVYSKISDPFRDFGELLGAPRLGSEKAFELNYSLQVTPYFLLQPVFQYYVGVGGNPTLSNAPVLGFRTNITF